jgi:hypothetical protein
MEKINFIYLMNDRKNHAYVRLGYMICLHNYQKNKVSKYSFVPEEVPPINVYCILSLNSWYNCHVLT